MNADANGSCSAWDSFSSNETRICSLIGNDQYLKGPTDISISQVPYTKQRYSHIFPGPQFVYWRNGLGAISHGSDCLAPPCDNSDTCQINATKSPVQWFHQAKEAYIISSSTATMAGIAFKGRRKEGELYRLAHKVLHVRAVAQPCLPRHHLVQWS